MTFRHGPLMRGFTTLCLAAAPLLFAAEGMSSAGIRWTIPAGWAAQPARQMRVATYTLPAAAGAEPGECGVFYFGQGRGGSAKENIARWGTQFENAPSPATVIETVDGMKVHRVQTSGTYLAPAGPMMQSSGKKPGYRLMGAIVEAPEGLVFFKCTGPARTMATAERAFDGLVKSIRKVPAKKF
jgi:hypothetical protein